MVSITIPVPVPYGKANANSIYVRKKSDGSEKNITYYHIGHNILQRLNNLWTFTLDLVSVTAADKADWILENNEILIFWGTELRMKGRIEKISYDNYERCHIEGVGMAVQLRDRDINEDFLNTDSDDIVTSVNDSIMSIDTNTNYGKISMSFQTENRLKALSGTVQGIDYDWWEGWKAADDYVTNYINVDDFKGDPTSTKTTFYTSGSSANMNVVSEEADTYESTDHVTVLGYGDGVNQIKAISYHATEDRTTLDKPLDAILETDVSSGTSVRVYDASGIDNGDTIEIDGESFTVSGAPVDNTTYWTITTGAAVTRPHVAGAEVIKTGGAIHCVDSSSLPAPSGNVWIGQEKISYSANDGTDLTIDTRGVAYKNTNIKKPYFHGEGIEVEDAQYTPDSPDTPSYITTDGIRSRTFNQSTIIQQNMADYLAQRIRIDRQGGVNLIKGEVADPMEILSTTVLKVGDWVELSDTYTGFSTGTRYEIVGMEYGFDTSRGEYCTVEISNYDATLLENTVKETDNLGKYYKGATNIFEVSDSENCDKTHPLILPFRIPTDAVAVNKVLASYYVDDYRAYSSADSGLESTHTHSLQGKITTSNDAPDINDDGTESESYTGNDDWETVDTFSPTEAGSKCIVQVNCMIYPNTDININTIVSCRIKSGSSYWPNSSGCDSRVAVYRSGGDISYAYPSFYIEISENPEDEDYDIQLDMNSDLDAYVYANWQVVEKHTHTFAAGVATATGSEHKHSINFGISDNTSDCNGINIQVDNGDGNWSAIGALAGNPYNATRDQDIDITSLVGRETGWKRIKFTPVANAVNGECKITGIANIQTFIQSKI